MRFDFRARAIWLVAGLLLATASCGDSAKKSTRSGGPVDANIPTDASGFTVFTQSSDTRTIYVSSSQGDDANDGLSQDHPVKTVAHAIGLVRDGFPDWILFRKGDVWHEAIGHWMKSGRSPTEPMLVSSYGTGARPQFRTAAGQHGIETFGGDGAPPSTDNVAFVGLHLYSSTRDSSSPDWAGYSDAVGVRWLRGTTFLLFEDCVIQSFGNGIVFDGETDHIPMSGIILHRNLVLDSWDYTHAQSIYLALVSGILLDENVVIHKGYDSMVSGSMPTIFSQAIYVQSDSSGVVVRNNVVLNGTSNGIQLRPGGLAEGNLFVRNAIGMLGADDINPPPGQVGVTLRNNVILEGTDIDPSTPRGWGIDLNMIAKAVVEGNIVAHAISPTADMTIKDDPNTTYTNNIVYDWGPNPNTPAGPFVDPNRTVETYNATRGGPGTYDDFVAELRQQSKDRWRPDYMAQAVNAYIREGFASP